MVFIHLLIIRASISVQHLRFRVWHTKTWYGSVGGRILMWRTRANAYFSANVIIVQGIQERCVRL
jgi:hypothetical protein